MTRKQIFEKAEEMGVDRFVALKCKLTYIREEISRKKEYLQELLEDIQTAEGLTKAFLEQSISATKNDINKLQKKHARLVTPDTGLKGITDDNVIEAREYPVDQLMEFGSNGRCMAFCHKSNTESMSYNNRDNKAHCFVCNKSFNPIDILMERDGLSFIDAVKELI